MATRLPASQRTREELKVRNPKAQFVYPGTCRNRTDQPDLPHVVRFKSPREGATRPPSAELRAGPVTADRRRELAREQQAAQRSRCQQRTPNW